MRNYSIEIDGKEIEFRLTSEDMVKLEEKNHVKIIDYIRDYSFTNIITLLMYMRKGVEKNFTKEDAYRLFDELADHDMSMETILKDIIYPTCQISGLLTKSDLTKIQDMMENPEAIPQATQE